jgi:hypothetical protein
MRIAPSSARHGHCSLSIKGESDNCVYVAPFTKSLQPIPCGTLFHALSSAQKAGLSSTAACNSRAISVFNPLYIGSGLVQTLLSGMLGRSTLAHAPAFFRPSTPDRNLWFLGSQILQFEESANEQLGPLDEILPI